MVLEQCVGQGERQYQSGSRVHETDFLLQPRTCIAYLNNVRNRLYSGDRMPRGPIAHEIDGMYERRIDVKDSFAHLRIIA